jgi:polyhydroxyalkanoate synthesis regulator phasin
MNIEELKEEIVSLKNRIKGLENDLDLQIEKNYGIAKMYNAIREIQDELVKKGYWFNSQL